MKSEPSRGPDVARRQIAHVLAHAVLADEHAAAQDLDDAFGREQVGDVVVARLVDVVAVDAREILELVDVLQTLHFASCAAATAFSSSAMRGDRFAVIGAHGAGIARGAAERQRNNATVANARELIGALPSAPLTGFG